MKIITPSSAGIAKINAALREGSDYALASAAADCLLEHVAHPTHIFVCAERRGAPWPDNLYVGWSNEHCHGIRTKSRPTAHQWLIDAFLGGLTPRIHVDQPSMHKCISVGSLADIRDDVRYGALTPPPSAPEVKTLSVTKMRGDDTKAPGGTHTLGDVREIIRKVAAELSKEDAKAVMVQHGGGVDKLFDLAPQYYDRVHARCTQLLSKKPSASVYYGSHLWNSPEIVKAREVIRDVAKRIDIGSAKDILWDVGGVERLMDLKVDRVPAVIRVCNEALAAGRYPIVDEPKPAPVTSRSSPFTGVASYKIEFFEGLGDALVGYNSDGSERTIIAAFNERRHADFVCELLQAAK
jgi:hypothetical protein